VFQCLELRDPEVGNFQNVVVSFLCKDYVFGGKICMKFQSVVFM